MKVEEIRSLEQLQALQPRWNETLRRSGRPSLYLTFEWLSTWWECFRDDSRELFILAVTEGEELLGLAPLMKVRRRYFGIPTVKLEFVSARDFAFSHLAIACSLELILTERKAEVVAAIVSHLVECQTDWQFLRLDPIPDDSPTLVMLETEALRQHLRPRRGDSSPSFEIRLDSDWDPYFSQRPARFVRNLRKDERLLRRQGNVEYVHCDSLEQLDHKFDAVLDIERRSWKWTRGLSINCVGYRNFFPALGDVASRTGWLRLSLLRLNGKDIAYCFAVAYEGTEECFKTAYDKSWKSYSPGHLLQWRRFEQDFRKGASRFNLMGGAPEYKRYWSTHTLMYHEVFVFNDQLRSRLMYFVFFTLHLYGKFRYIPDLSKRLLRRLGFQLKGSELTRMDQLHSRKQALPKQQQSSVNG